MACFTIYIPTLKQHELKQVEYIYTACVCVYVQHVFFLSLEVLQLKKHLKEKKLQNKFTGVLTDNNLCSFFFYT